MLAGANTLAYFDKALIILENNFLGLTTLVLKEKNNLDIQNPMAL
jgi:hypothetical protein